MSSTNKVSAPIAINKRCKADISSDHVTTMDIFKIKPVFNREIMPKSSIKINSRVLTRLNPLEKPFYGRLDQLTRAFFVPYRTCWKHFNDFIEGTPVVISGISSVLTEVPYITNLTLRGALMTEATAGTSSDYDFANRFNSSNSYYKLTKKGRYMYDLLRCLGYEVSFRYTQEQEVSSTTKMSALPLFAYLKVWADWYYNTVYEYPLEITRLLNWDDGEVDAALVKAALEFVMYANYDQDIFTAAWDNPVGPTQTHVPNHVAIPDITLATKDNTFVQDEYPGDNTPVITSLDGAPHKLTQYAVDALRALTDFYTRRKLVGYKVLDRYMAEWGIKLPDANLNRSIYLGSDVTPIDVSDVTSTSETGVQGGALGDYAGKGIAYGSNGHFEWSSDEFGQIIITSTLVPHIGYVNGRDRELQHLAPLDFFNGDFDGLGCQPIRVDEIKADYDHFTSGGAGAAHIFGWASRYYEYQIPHDRLTGDFRFNTRGKEQLSCYHLFRLFPDSTSSDMLTHSNNFVVGDQQYDRIFGVTDGENDNFYSIFRFNVNVSLPMKPLWDSYHFGHEGEAHEVTSMIGGTRLN